MNDPTPVRSTGSLPEAAGAVGQPSDAGSGIDPYDAVVLVSFGGPEAPEDVVPFLRNVTRGRGIPEERLAQVGEHYFLLGGRSPINDQCRMLQEALQQELSDRGVEVPLYWGNRNWDPFLSDAFAQMAADGHRRVLAVTTSAYPSYSSCRQYRENLHDAAQGTSITVDRVRLYAHHPAFAAASVDATVAALESLGTTAEPAHLLFVTHSVPIEMARTSGPPPKTPDGGYVDWHRTLMAEVVRQVNERRRTTHEAELVYCSRSGPATQPWLEPDVNDRMAELAEAGAAAVVAVPIGFISDHMEVIYDLDTEARATAERLGLAFARAATAGVAPVFVAGLVDLLLERAAVARGDLVPQPVIPGGIVGLYRCLPSCCPNLREPGRPAVCQTVEAL